MKFDMSQARLQLQINWYTCCWPGSTAASAMSLSVQCGVCVKPIKEDQKKVFCFGPCGLVKHLKCSDEVDDAGWKALETNRGLKYLCHGCRKHQSDFNSVIFKCNEMLQKFNDNMDMLRSVEEKMQNMEQNVKQMVQSEMKGQKSELNELLNAKSKEVEEKIQSLTKQVSNNQKKGTSGPNTRANKKKQLENKEETGDNVDATTPENNDTEVVVDSTLRRESFADMLKKDTTEMKENESSESSVQKNDTKENESSESSVQKSKKTDTVIVVRPKEKGKSAQETKNVLKAKLDRGANQIQTVRSGNGGAIILEVKSAAMVQSVIETVKEKCGEGFEVAVPKSRRPRLKVLGVGDDLKEDELMDCLKKQNDIPVQELKIVTSYTTERGGETAYNYIIEVDQAAHETLIEMGWVDIDWDNCRIVECFGIIRCFKCCSYGHKSTNCSKQQVCPKCAGNHKANECSGEEIHCANCDRMNKSRNMNLDTNHCAYSVDCVVYQKLVERSRQRQDK